MDVGVAADAPVVPVERSTVGRLRSREGRHRDGTRISLPLEELVEIGILELPQPHAHVDHPRHSHPKARLQPAGRPIHFRRA
ncbi:hypothetical protein GCM10009844_29700 [Nocardioides koreensis]|uniref:Uncharacterized protein n=1 Tax=Nocardioides koreensis TaxID=433651 RepID=A0ABP5LNB8_9ACTN